LGRKHFIRSRIERFNGSYQATIAGPQGSGILRSMILANGLIVVPEDVSCVEAGTDVTVQLFDLPEVN